MRDQGAAKIFVGNDVLAALDLVVPWAATVHDQENFSESLPVVNNKNSILSMSQLTSGVLASINGRSTLLSSPSISIIGASGPQLYPIDVVTVF